VLHGAVSKLYQKLVILVVCDYRWKGHNYVEFMEQRLVELENQAEQLRQHVLELRVQFEEHQQLGALKAENQLLRQAILRYALACGAVDLQMALVRSRHERNPESVEQLKQATDEEEAASRALRDLTQSLQIAAQERSDDTFSSGG
jgi:hypothetical protein